MSISRSLKQTLRHLRRAIILLLVLTVGLLIGWQVKATKVQAYLASIENHQTVRLGGYRFAAPLILGDANPNKDSHQLAALKNKVQHTLDQEVKNKNIDISSVYFRDLNAGNQININPREKYFPASLIKVLYLSTYYKQAESNPGILSQTLPVSVPFDINTKQEIKVKNPVKIGDSYSVSQLIERMITSSDDNATFALFRDINVETLTSLTHALKLKLSPTEDAGQDYITAENYSYLFRVLYNATYLHSESSDKALELLTTTDFNDGLVAGLPAGTVTAHKFGLATYEDANKAVYKREMHDCGIVYYPGHPYVLCVMTKSSAGVSRAEAAIKDISAAVYQEVRKGNL